jgi:hypothetical protein
MPTLRPELRFRHPVAALALSSALAGTLAACSTVSPALSSAGGPALTKAAAAASPAASSVVSSAASPATSPAAPPAAPPAASAPTARAAPAARPPDPSAPKPFDEVTKDAKVQDGLFPLWRKDEKVWIEIPKSALGKPFLFTFNIANAVGERGLYASQMGRDYLAEWRRVGNQLQLVALNTLFRAEGAGKTAVEQAFSPSLLLAGPAASADHPQRQSVLLDASALLGDLPALSTRLEAAFRLPYAPDRANSHIEALRADKTLSVITTRMHYATPRIPAPPAMPSPTPTPGPVLPQTTPDPRSLFFSVVYNLRALPEQPMATRRADPRLGHFTEAYSDLSTDLRANPRVHMVQRWRLEKKDAAAALSEPVQPIVYWLDKNIPPRYRPAVEAGILEWNKAFEKIGFKNAVVARQQPDDADWDNMDATHASIRWFVGADVGFAIGPSHTDPRTGEILDADIGMSDVFGRGARRLVVEDLQRPLGEFASPTQGLPWARNGARDGAAAHCQYSHEAAAELSFALDLLETRGDLAPDSPQAEAFVLAVIKDTIMHEVGHTVGLKHNFKASTTVTRAQLKDRAFTEANGVSGSVMDYNAYNLPLPGEPTGSPNNTTLGAYDYWAIEYAYKPIEESASATELARIAARSGEPALAYADDVDAGGGFGPMEGFDPLANRFDLGDDPLAWYQRRMALSKELWARVQARVPSAGEDPLRLRRSLLSGFRQLRDLPALAAKYVGGLHAVRDLPGSKRPSFTPVDPQRQREALQFLAKEVLSADSFRFRPEFLANLAPDYIEWDRGVPVSIPAIVLQLQIQAVERLLSAGTATRLLDLPLLVRAPSAPGKAGAVGAAGGDKLISLSEVYATLQSAVWSELSAGGEIDRMRRNLQREHLRRVMVLLTRGSTTLPADALSLMRLHAHRLQAELQRAVRNTKASVETRAHLQESLGGLTEALRATMQRS